MATEDRVQHTPGPWEATHSETGRIYIAGPDGDLAVLIHYEHAEADAHLIAAAPDMLVALDRIAHGDSGAAGQRAETTLELAKALAINAQNIARDAIALATGGAA